METLPSSMEINVISAEDLRLGGRRLAKGTFVTVRVGSLPHQQASTDVDSGDRCSGCPSWSHKLSLPVPPQASSMTLEVMYCRNRRGGGASSSGARPVAAATVPLSDFVDVGPDGWLHFLSYRLRDARRERNGIVNFSVRVFGGARPRRVVLHESAAPTPVPVPVEMWRAGFGHGAKKETEEDGVAMGYPVGYRR